MQPLPSPRGRLLQGKRPGQAAAEPEEIPPVPGREGLPLSFAQQRLWFIEQLAPGGSLYNMPLVVRLRGALDGPALQRAVNRVMYGDRDDP